MQHQSIFVYLALIATVLGASATLHGTTRNLLEGLSPPLRLVHKSTCQTGSNSFQDLQNQIVSLRWNSFGFFSQTEEVIVHANLSISCGERLVYTLLTLAHWNISVDCATPRFLFGHESFEIQEKTRYALRLVVKESEIATLMIDDFSGDQLYISSPKELPGIPGDAYLTMVPDGDTQGSIELYNLQTTRKSVSPRGQIEKADAQSIIPVIQISPFSNGIVRVNELVTIRVAYRDKNGIKEVDSGNILTKMSISGIVDHSLNCTLQGRECSVLFRVAGMYSCTFNYAIDGKALNISRDLIVRKQGDKSNSVDTHLSSLFSTNALRPLDRGVWRSQHGLTISRAIGWSDQYYFGGDLESERLFDYRILQDMVTSPPSNIIRCSDAFLVGGPPIVKSDDHQGHGKRVLFVPMKYNPENTETSQFSLTRRPIESIVNFNASKFGCYKSEVENLIEYTGMFDMINQQVILDSYGSLSLDMNPIVAKEVTIDDLQRIYPPVSPYKVLSEGLALAAESHQGKIWARVALSPFPYKPYMPAFKVWYRGPKDIVATTTCSISRYHMIHELYHMLGYHHPYQYRVQKLRFDNGTQIIDPLHDSGEWTKDTQYQESFDALGCCSGDASLSTRILNGWITWEGSRLEFSHQDLHQQNAARQDLILYPFDSPEISRRQSPLAIVLKMNESHILICGYRDLVRWPLSFNGEDETNLATRFNLAGIECEVLCRESKDWSAFKRATLDFSLLKGDIFHHEDGTMPRKMFSLLGEQMAFHHHLDKHSRLMLVHKGLVLCDRRDNVTETSLSKSKLIRNYMGLNDDYPFRETYSKRATYSLQSQCAAIHFYIGGDGNHQRPLQVEYRMSSDENGALCLYLHWNSDKIKVSGASLKTHTNETIKSFISFNELQPIPPPLRIERLSYPCLKAQTIYRVNIVDYQGRSVTSQLKYLETDKIEISSRFSNNYDQVEYRKETLPIPQEYAQEGCLQQSKAFMVPAWDTLLMYLYLTTELYIMILER